MNALLFAATLLCVPWSPSARLTAAVAASPAWDWAIASPEGQGLDDTGLKTLWTELQERHTTAFLVIRNDKIVFERYANGHSRTAKHYTASMAKALVGGVSLALALSDGHIALDDQASQFVPQWRNDTAKFRITIRQLGSHTSGLADAE